MNEWSVYLVLASLIGTLAMIVRPVIGLTQAITRLTATVEGMRGELDRMAHKNTESHRRLWQHNEEQDRRLAVCERQLTVREGGTHEGASA